MTIEYNGFTFPTTSHVTVNVETVTDEADRTALYQKHKVQVVAMITSCDPLDPVGNSVLEVRQKLTKFGRGLVIENEGFGPRLEVNTGATGTPRDVDFGPKPRILNWTPVGQSTAAEIVWECEFCIAVCDGVESARDSGLAALNYAVRYSINERGYSTRTISGYLEIAMTRNGRALPDTADAYRDLVVVDHLYGFHRTTDWQLSNNKKRADFSIVDREIDSPNPYPVGVVEISAQQTCEWNRAQTAQISNTISGTIKLAHNQPRQKAWEIFKSIVAARLAAATNNSNPFLQNIRVTENLFAPEISFSVNYRLLEEVSQLFSVTGLFDGLPFNWVTYRAFIDDIQTHRGNAALAHTASEDQIIDLCTSTFLTEASAGQQSLPTPVSPEQVFCNDVPDPQYSYLRFEAGLSTLEDHKTVAMVTLGEDDLEDAIFSPAEPLAQNGNTDATKNIERIVEEASASLRFEWSGYAERAGYPIPRPNKIQIGSLTLVRDGKQAFKQRRLGTFFCIPVYAAAWKVRYAVETRPTTVDPDAADPVGTQGGSP